MSDNPYKVSLTADELKALDLVISIAQSQGISQEQGLSFITSIASALTSAVSNVTKVVQAVAPVVQAAVPVVQAVAPVVASIIGGAATAQSPQHGGHFNPNNLTLSDLIELRRRANQP
jgi:hypothetical protein